MELPAIQSLECRFELSLEARRRFGFGRRPPARRGHPDLCDLGGRLRPPVEEDFTIRFVPAGTEREDPDPDLPDEIPYEADTIDLGEATAEQLGLALDPWPRIEGATVPVIDDEDDGSPFAILARRTRAGSDQALGDPLEQPAMQSPGRAGIVWVMADLTRCVRA